MGRLAGALLASACVLVAARSPARADDRSAEAARLFEIGRSLAAKGKYAEACKVFATSLDLEVAAGTQLNVGDCAERDGDLVEAWRQYSAALATYERTNKTSRASFAEKRQAAVAAKLVTLHIRVAAPERAGLVVTVDHEPVPVAADITTVTTPGAIEIVATEPGHRAVHRSITGVAGESYRVLFPVTSADTEADGPPDADPELQPEREPPHPRERRPPDPHVDTLDPSPSPSSPRVRSRIYLAAGLGLGALAAGTIGTAVALAAKSEYDDAIATCHPLCTTSAKASIDHAAARADLATGLAITTGLAAAAAIVVYVTAPRERVRITPSASASTVGAVLTARF